MKYRKSRTTFHYFEYHCSLEKYFQPSKIPELRTTSKGEKYPLPQHNFLSKSVCVCVYTRVKGLKRKNDVEVLSISDFLQKYFWKFGLNISLD